MTISTKSSVRSILASYLVTDFPIKARAMLLQIKEVRNKRAHDNPISARDAYRIIDIIQQFFELT